MEECWDANSTRASKASRSSALTNRLSPESMGFGGQKLCGRFVIDRTATGFFNH